MVSSFLSSVYLLLVNLVDKCSVDWYQNFLCNVSTYSEAHSIW